MITGREVFNAPAVRGFSVTGGPGLPISGGGATSDLVIDIAATNPVANTVTKNSTITVTSFGGFADPVALSIEGLVPGLTASLTPGTVTPTGTSAVVLTAQKTLASQRLILIVKGTAGDETREEYRRLRIRRLDGDFSLSLSRTSITVARGQSFSFVASVTSVDDDYAEVSIGLSGLPVNSTYFQSPANGFVVGERSTTNVSLNVVTWSGISVLGHYTITVTAVSWHHSHSQTIDLEVTA